MITCMIGFIGFIVGDFILGSHGYGFWLNGKYLSYAFFPELFVSLFIIVYCLFIVKESDLRVVGCLGGLIILMLLVAELAVSGVLEL